MGEAASERSHGDYSKGPLCKLFLNGQMSGQGQFKVQNVVFHVWRPGDTAFCRSWPKLSQNTPKGKMKVPQAYKAHIK